MQGTGSLFTSLAVVQLAGLLIGLVAFVLLPVVMPGIDPMHRWGILLWYPTLGTVVALMERAAAGADRLCRVPWWLRSAIVGGWLNLVATLLAHDTMRRFMESAFGTEGPLSSPFWFVPEGAAAGIGIGYLMTRFGGERRAPVDELDD